MPAISYGHLYAPIDTASPADMALSGDGTTLYVAGTDGNIRVYDLATRTLEATWDVGMVLGGMDLSPDGDFLLVTEGAVVSAPDGGHWESTLTVYRVATADGAISSYSTQVEGSDRYAYDVAILSNGTALLTADAYSAHLPVWQIDLATGGFEASDQNYHVGAAIAPSLDHSQAIFSPPLSDAPLYVFEAGAGITHQHLLYQDGVMGYTFGRQAISLEGDLIAQSTGSNLYIYDSSLDYQFELGALHPEHHLGSNIIGLVFDAAGENLYLLQGPSSTIYQLATDDWSIVRTFDVGAGVMESAGEFGNRLLLSADGRYFTVFTDQGVQLVENDALANDFTGTADADDLAAGLGTDRILGLGGDDRLDGGAGADRLEGGLGDDYYIVDQAGDLIVELAGEGIDHVRSTASHSLHDHVDNLTLGGGAAIDGIGNALANILTGNNAANRLDGRAGADTMIGGLGHDTYVVDQAGDAIVEQGSSGNDIVLSAIGFTLPTHFERLVLTGASGIDGRGNAGANTITGNRSSNLLSGGRGNDIIDGAAGNDQILGGAGSDRLKGGTGDDRFYFNEPLGSANVDRILDFVPADDAIRLHRSIFTRAGGEGTLKAGAFHQGAAAADAGDRILYDAASGNIFYDADGSGAAAAILFAIVTPGTALTYADFTIYG